MASVFGWFSEMVTEKVTLQKADNRAEILTFAQVTVTIFFLYITFFVVYLYKNHSQKVFFNFIGHIYSSK